MKRSSKRCEAACPTSGSVTRSTRRSLCRRRGPFLAQNEWFLTCDQRIAGKQPCFVMNRQTEPLGQEGLQHHAILSRRSTGRRLRHYVEFVVAQPVGSDQRIVRETIGALD